ncbi:hypothetical protein DFJ73DRAFT_767977 [Zopfochytrium polystomum]|nr:hypothetical protein DFJ73DRAFT_767977 [Zopfochytrium polystomum]
MSAPPGPAAAAPAADAAPAVAAAVPAAPPKKPTRQRLPCMFGTDCFRKNQQHKDQYAHPADPDYAAAAAAAAASLKKELEYTDSEDTEVDGKGKDGDYNDVDDDGMDVATDDDDEIGTKKKKKKKAPAAAAALVAGRRAGGSDGGTPSPRKRARVSATGGAAATADGDEDDDDDDDTADATASGKRPRRSKASKLAPPKVSRGPIKVMLAEKWDPTVDPTGWWMSEKLDGIRAYFDPVARTLSSREGNRFYAPAWFVKPFPKDMSLDGELFIGRGRFSETVSVVKSHESPHWNRITYKVFDSPSMEGMGFEARLAALQDYFEDDEAGGDGGDGGGDDDEPATKKKKRRVKHVEIVRHVKCKGEAHLTSELKAVEKKGGEGLMLRKPRSQYEHRRSRTLLKVKSFYDAEAVVIGHEQGKGKNAGVMGALMCRMANGTTFKVGSGFTDAERRKPPKKGAIITYKFQELSQRGHPRFPTFVGVRIDASKPSDAVIRPIVRTKSDIAKDKLFAVADDDDDDDEDGDE